MKFIERRNTHRPITKRIVVIYHANCSDGFGAAWAAWKKFGKKADYIPARHQSPLPPGLRDKEIYTVDFTYPWEITKKLLKANRRVTSIDHHISAKETTLKTDHPLYAVNHSGAVLSWMYFHPKKPVPLLLKYIEDTDIWHFALPKSKELFAYLELFDFNFTVWAKLARGFERAKERRAFAEKGALILKYEQKLIERLIANNTEKVRFLGRTVYAVNSPLFQSELGHLLSKKLPPLAIIWNASEEGTRVSLRSNGSVDVSNIAKRFGGGGHKAAAGFSIPKGKKFPWIPCLAKRLKSYYKSKF